MAGPTVSKALVAVAVADVTSGGAHSSMSGTARTSPERGVVSLSGFSDSTKGEARGIRFYDKVWRYSNDGIVFSGWMPLTQGSVSSALPDPLGVFVAEFSYSRSGPSPSGLLGFTSVTLDAVIDPPDCGQGYSLSAFADYFDCNDPVVLGWALNVLEKLYSRGLLPEYISRGAPGDDDSDFLAFWHSMAVFFAYPVRLAREFAFFSDNTALLRGFLEDRGLYLSGGESHSELRALMRGFYSEMGKRGTVGIASEGVDGGGSVVAPRGELRRLLCSEPWDYFQMVHSGPEWSSWTLGRSSPGSRSTEGNPGFDISWEPGRGFEDKGKYPLLNPDFIDFRDGKMVIKAFEWGNGAGILRGGPEFMIKVDPGLNYSISFDITLLTGDVFGLSFGAPLFDKSHERIPNANTYWFFLSERRLPRLYQVGRPYRIVGVVFKEGILADAHRPLACGYGRHLNFVPGASYFRPEILVTPPFDSAPDTDMVEISNFTVCPSSLPYSPVGLGGGRTDFIIKNRNGDVSNAGVRDALRSDLSPAGTAVGTVFL